MGMVILLLFLTIYSFLYACCVLSSRISKIEEDGIILKEKE